MPIHPDNRDRYPADWPTISLRIKTRAGWRCECEGECGRLHDRRCQHEQWMRAEGSGAMVVLTVAHLDHTPENCSEDNLKAMCQRCHLSYDIDHHRQSRLRRQQEALVAAGQLALIGSLKEEER